MGGELILRGYIIIFFFYLQLGWYDNIVNHVNINSSVSAHLPKLHKKAIIELFKLESWDGVFRVTAMDTIQCVPKKSTGLSQRDLQHIVKIINTLNSNTQSLSVLPRVNANSADPQTHSRWALVVPAFYQFGTKWYSDSLNILWRIIQAFSGQIISLSPYCPQFLLSSIRKLLFHVSCNWVSADFFWNKHFRHQIVP